MIKKRPYCQNRMAPALFVCCLFFQFPANAQQALPDAPPKLWSIAHANSIMARFPDPDNIPHRAWCYNQGYILSGFEMLVDLTGDQKYFEYIKRFVDQHVDAEGNIRGYRGDHLDDIMAGTAIVAVYKKTGEEKYRLAAERIRNAFRTYSRNSDGGFWHADSIRWPQRSHEMWIDGVFMGQMFLIRYGEVIGEREYCYDEATKQILSLASHCRKGDTGLFLHGYDENKTAAWADPVTGLSPEVWSEGLGWYALVVVETMKVLPANHPNRAAVLEILQEMVEGLRKTQDSKTGLWYQVVDKGHLPDNWHDTSGSAMFVYAIQRAIDLGLVSREKYEPVATKGYHGLLTKAAINDHGLVDLYDACDGLGVQKSYADYINFPKRINAKEAIGGFLWAAIAVEKPTAEKLAEVQSTTQLAADRATWMREARWGVMTHYLADWRARADSIEMSVAKWNELIDNFDVEGLAEQIKSVGAGYYIMTIGQNSGYYLSPNATYDRLVDIQPSKCSRRDLIADLYEALNLRGIKLIVYLPSGAPNGDAIAKQKLEWQNGPYPNREFQIRWEQVIREWSERWGDRVAGWWFDGCYWPNTMYRSKDAPNFESFAAAARAGHPQRLVAFNRGVIPRIISITPFEDYTAGEISDPTRMEIRRANDGKIDSAQIHILSFLGERWGMGSPRFSADQIVEWSKQVQTEGGVITWDVPIQASGLISQPFIEQLKAVNEALK